MADITINLTNEKSSVLSHNGIFLVDMQSNNYKVIAGEQLATSFELVYDKEKYKNYTFSVEIVNAANRGIIITQGTNPQTDIVNNVFLFPIGAAVQGYAQMTVSAVNKANINEIVKWSVIKIKVWETNPNWKEHIDPSNPYVTQEQLATVVEESVKDKASLTQSNTFTNSQWIDYDQGGRFAIQIQGVDAEIIPPAQLRDNIQISLPEKSGTLALAEKTAQLNENNYFHGQQIIAGRIVADMYQHNESWENGTIQLVAGDSSILLTTEDHVDGDEILKLPSESGTLATQEWVVNNAGKRVFYNHHIVCSFRNGDEYGEFYTTITTGSPIPFDFDTLGEYVESFGIENGSLMCTGYYGNGYIILRLFLDGQDNDLLIDIYLAGDGEHLNTSYYALSLDTFFDSVKPIYL